MRKKALIADLALFLVALLFAAPAGAAATPTAEQAPAWAGQVRGPSLSATGTYYGHSGVSPYQAFGSLSADEVFVADRGAKLDQYLCRSDGPITFDLDIT